MLSREPRPDRKRSTNSQGKTFRMTAEGSDFRYAFNWPGTSGHLLVFEAPIDMLSFIEDGILDPAVPDFKRSVCSPAHTPPKSPARIT